MLDILNQLNKLIATVDTSLVLSTILLYLKLLNSTFSPPTFKFKILLKIMSKDYNAFKENIKRKTYMLEFKKHKKELSL